MSISTTLSAQTTDTLFLQNLLKSHPDLFSGVLAHPRQNDIQILYTQIDRDKDNKPHFKSFSYHLDPAWYFYPASTVKLPTAIFALEKINRLASVYNPTTSWLQLSAHIPMHIDSISDHSLSIAACIKKILLVSDNAAFNTLYEFIGRKEINQKLKENGLNHSRILNRLAIGDGGEAARHTKKIIFLSDEANYTQPAQYDSLDYPLALKNLKQGKGYLNAKNELINEPFDFSDKNVFSIADQQEVMKKLIFPEYFPENKQFRLANDDYHLLYKYMSMYPTESKEPTFNPKENWATYCKFLFYGSDKNAVPDPNIRVFNKIGNAYGYLIDNAYFVDFNNKVEFLLTAVIHVNEDGIYNDNKYEYETVGYPFMKNLGQVVYQHELKRPKNRLPNLSKFKIDYSK